MYENIVLNIIELLMERIMLLIIGTIWKVKVADKRLIAIILNLKESLGGEASITPSVSELTTTLKRKRSLGFDH